MMAVCVALIIGISIYSPEALKSLIIFLVNVNLHVRTCTHAWWA